MGPLYFAERLTEHYGGAKIYLKRDELNHTGSHKINNCLGQILLAKRMGKSRIIAETGAGQHGVAVATVAARFGLPCTVFMGATDIDRQKLLAVNICCAHKYCTRQTKARCHRCHSNPVLTCSGFGNDTTFAHALCQQYLTKAVIYFVRPCVI